MHIYLIYIYLAKKRSLGGADLISLLDEVDLVGDLDLALDDLGGDLQDLEEGGLARITASRTSVNAHIYRSDSTDTSRSGHSVSKNEIADFGKISVGEHEADIASHLDIKRGVIMSRISLKVILKDFAH